MQTVTFLVLICLGFAISFPFPAVDNDSSKDNQGMDKKSDFVKVARNLYQFGQMIHCATDKSQWDYNGYGCFCGKGGKGVPVDDTDRCCHVHDACYTRIQKENLCWSSASVYLRTYKRDNTCTGCADKVGSCGRAICECDGAAARCFARSHYNRKYDGWPKSNC